MTKTSSRPPAIHLGHSDPDGQVVVHAGDDLFLLTVQEAVNACGAWGKMAAFQSQMKDLIGRLNQWVSARPDKIRDAYFSVKAGGGLFFLVVTKGKKFDSALEDELSDLDMEVANSADLDLLRLSVLAVPDSPAEVVDSFLTQA